MTPWHSSSPRHYVEVYWFWDQKIKGDFSKLLKSTQNFTQWNKRVWHPMLRTDVTVDCRVLALAITTQCLRRVSHNIIPREKSSPAYITSAWICISTFLPVSFLNVLLGFCIMRLVQHELQVWNNDSDWMVDWNGPVKQKTTFREGRGLLYTGWLLFGAPLPEGRTVLESSARLLASAREPRKHCGLMYDRMQKATVSQTPLKRPSNTIHCRKAARGARLSVRHNVNKPIGKNAASDNRSSTY